MGRFEKLLSQQKAGEAGKIVSNCLSLRCAYTVIKVLQFLDITVQPEDR